MFSCGMVSSFKVAAASEFPYWRHGFKSWHQQILFLEQKSNKYFHSWDHVSNQRDAFCIEINGLWNLNGPQFLILFSAELIKGSRKKKVSDYCLKKKWMTIGRLFLRLSNRCFRFIGLQQQQQQQLQQQLQQQQLLQHPPFQNKLPPNVIVLSYAKSFVLWKKRKTLILPFNFFAFSWIAPKVDKLFLDLFWKKIDQSRLTFQQLKIGRKNFWLQECFWIRIYFSVKLFQLRISHSFFFFFQFRSDVGTTKASCATV